MPVLDMPLAELKKYQGRTPRPADFDEFWDKSLCEMKSIDPNIELVPAKFKSPSAECFDLYFTGTGDCRIHAKYLRPTDKPGPHPGIVLFHGYSGSSGDWSEKLNYVSAGFSVLALDCRGQAGSSEDKISVKGNTLHGHIIRGLQEDSPEKLYFRNTFLDTAQAAGILMNMKEVDSARVAAMGGSQGGGLTLACAALEPRIARAVANFPFLCDYKRVWDMDLDKNAYRELREYFRHFDPRHEKEEDIFTRLGYIDVQFLAPRIKGEIRMAVGLIDEVCPPSSQFAAYNKISSPKDLVIYPDFGHEGLPGMSDIAFQWICELL
ncbi:MAG: acetylesterase [Lentisphaerae bacterium GWF2_45_14]|nr:MAG: acetylesterase [Lentisphaerae bacterium GWF2_45_14]